MNRQRLIARLCGLIAVCALYSAAAAQISDDVVKLGVLTDLSGPAADATGQGSVTAAELAIEDFGGSVPGKPIQLVTACRWAHGARPLPGRGQEARGVEASPGLLQGFADHSRRPGVPAPRGRGLPAS
jgi:hypothetical protein